MDQSPDHIPVSTRLHLSSEPLPEIKRQTFKLVDMDKLQQLDKIAPPPRNLQNITEVDQYVKEIQDYLQRVIEAAVPWAKPSQEAKSF